MTALSTEVVGNIAQHCMDMSKDGLRVLAFANCHALHNGGDAATHNGPLDYVFLGLFGLRDPLRPNIKDAVLRIQDSGARVIMITGDSENTAVAIATKAGQ